MRIRTVIVDNDPFGQQEARRLLESQFGFEIIRVCATGNQAVDAIVETQPELVLLEVQLPDLDGFQVIETVGPTRMPLIIFVTAVAKYAVKAFDMRALDYVLKPFDEERFLRALDRARVHLQEQPRRELTAQPMELVSCGKRTSVALQRTTGNGLDRVVVRSAGRVVFLRACEVDFLQAEGNYVRLHVGSESYLHRAKISVWQDKLDSRCFVRIHRSIIVNIDRIRELRPWPTGEYVIIMRTGKELTLSRGYRDSLQLLTGEAI